MANKWHISKSGKPAICTAKMYPCPLGGIEEHYETQEDAYKEIARQGIKRNGWLPAAECNSEKVPPKRRIKYETTLDDMYYIIARKKFLGNQRKTAYMNKLYYSKEMFGFQSSEKKTIHYKEDRKSKKDKLIEEFGEGKLVGVYEVFHNVKINKKYQDKVQIIEVLDNGRITVYDLETKKPVTTFMAHRARLEAMFLAAGQIPDEDMLEEAAANRDRSHELGIK